MKVTRYLCAGAALFLCGCSTTPKPQVIVEQRFVERHIPSTLKRPCPPIWKKAGGPEVVGDLIDRGDVNEAGLRICAARMNKIIVWDKGG